MDHYIQVIDNFIPPDYQESIKAMLFSREFSWYFLPDVTFSKMEGNKGTPSLSHNFRSDGQTFSPVYNFISPMAFYATATAGVKFKEIIQARSFLQFPLNDTLNVSSIDPIHVDLPIDHLVCLYYVVDSDGDTIITSKKFKENTERINSYTENDVLKKVTPKQGRAVLFDGRLYHTAEQPKNNIRCVINIDII